MMMMAMMIRMAVAVVLVMSMMYDVWRCVVKYDDYGDDDDCDVDNDVR